jgi:hypothetical protein
VRQKRNHQGNVNVPATGDTRPNPQAQLKYPIHRVTNKRGKKK